MPHEFYEELHASFGVKELLDLAAGAGQAAKAFLRMKKVTSAFATPSSTGPRSKSTSRRPCSSGSLTRTARTTSRA
eukprot:15435878-Alexandrium_andersonii.AAC.1